MKKVILFLLVGCIVSSVSAQIIFVDGSFNQVLEKAKKENKKIFIDCYTSWCGPCKMLEKNIFPDPEVGKFMNERFVNFKSDMEKGEGVILRRKYNVSVFPTLLILNSDGSEFSRCVGAEDRPQDFIAMVGKMMENDINKARERFKISLEGANNFIQTLNDNYLIEERDRALVSVYGRRNTIENYSNANFTLYSSLITTIYHPIALSILNDSNSAIKYLGRKRYADFVKEKVDLTLTQMAMRNKISADKIHELEVMSKKYKEMKTPLLTYFIRIAPQIDTRNVDNVIAYSSKAFRNLDTRERRDMVRFVHRTAVNNRQMEKLIPFYELCVAQSRNEDEAKVYGASLELVKNLLTK